MKNTTVVATFGKNDYYGNIVEISDKPQMQETVNYWGCIKHIRVPVSVARVLNNPNECQKVGLITRAGGKIHSHKTGRAYTRKELQTI